MFEMLKTIMNLILSHWIGDYVLQSNYIALEKGKSFYLLFVHCSLYCVPFVLIFGYKIQIVFLFISHFLIDLYKARFNIISNAQDQFLHLAFLILIEMLTPFWPSFYLFGSSGSNPNHKETCTHVSGNSGNSKLLCMEKILKWAYMVSRVELLL